MTTRESVNSATKGPRKFYPKFKKKNGSNYGNKDGQNLKGDQGIIQPGAEVSQVLLGLLCSVVLPWEPLLLRVCPGNSRFGFWIWSPCSYKEMVCYQNSRPGSVRSLPESDALKAEERSEPVWTVHQTS